MSSFVLLKLSGVLIAVISQILLKRSAMKKHDNMIKEYLNFDVIVAYGLFFLSTLIGIYSLKGISISLSSIIESLSYILVPLSGYLFFHEKIGKIQMYGMIMIFIGIIVFGL